MICLMIRTIGFSPPMSRPGRSPRANMGVAVISIPASRSVAIDLRISSSEPARFGTGCVVLLLLFGGRAPVHQVVTGKGRLLPCATQEEVKKVRKARGGVGRDIGGHDARRFAAAASRPSHRANKRVR